MIAATVAREDHETGPVVFHRLTVSVNGAGHVQSSPNGGDCPSDCGELFAEGDVVNLLPIPAAPDSLLSWSGIRAGRDGSCQFWLTHDEAITATFSD